MMADSLLLLVLLLLLLCFLSRSGADIADDAGIVP
jgi:hypothetical protein